MTSIVTKYLIVLALGVSLVGCHHSPDVVTEYKYIEKPALNVPDPLPLQMSPVEFYVVTPENATEVVEEIEPSVLFALNENSYENLALNIERILGYIRELRIILDQYREYYGENIDESGIESTPSE